MKTIYFVLVFFLLSQFLAATIINVPADQPTIQAGIDVAVDADTVLVQPGTYVENINYNGKLITVASLFLTTQDTTYISQTIIDGNENGSVVTFTNNEDATAVLCGFIITNGLGGGTYPIQYGGGITCRSSSNPSIENVIITGNSNDYTGGGVYCLESSPSLKNVTISDNIAGYGGGFFCEDHMPSLQNVTITGNTAFDYGGGIYCYVSYPSLESVTISDNFAGSSGGGIISHSSNLTLTNSIVWNNYPQEIHLIAGAVTATYSNIEGGWAGTGNIDSDPLFVDPANGDYHLTEDSPCIDAGDPVSPFDPDGTITDMGAYFYPQFIPPEADFEANVTSGEAPLEVHFFDLSVPNYNPIISWQWDFDNDGTIDSDEQNPVYVYEEMGVYTVSLTVSDGYMSDTEIKVDYIEVTGARVEQNIAPLETFLGSNYPNPFNPITTIEFDIKEHEVGVLSIYNIKGQLIESHQFEAGQYNFQWDASDMSSGVYLYQLQTENNTVNKKMLLLK